MLRPSKKLVLALEAVTDIAFHGGAEPVQSQDIARRLQLPRRYLEQVMQQLVRAGILRGVRGPRGGCGGEGGSREKNDRAEVHDPSAERPEAAGVDPVEVSACRRP